MWRRALLANVLLWPALSVPPTLRVLALSQRGAIGALGFALRCAQQRSGEVKEVETVAVIVSVAPFGLARANGAINHIVNKKGDFTKKGVFTGPVKRRKEKTFAAYS